ncbi:MAG: hypothetical protein PHQ35_05980 [Phycisphaerae bacterium]|nr:hypothetical protein [Phycisphaerae bacterium]MDD5381273.1 hypothetical protein [Phycisphaerae bacterium]
MTKEINIHVKTTGTPQTKQDFKELGQSGQMVGQDIAAGQKQAGAATEESTKKISGMGRILENVATQAKAYIVAFIGWKAVQEVLNFIIEKLERIARLQNEVYEKSLTFSDIGQRIEFQTGTTGQQQYWTEQALKIQKAGALSNPAVAQQMMISADIAFAKQGGIKNPQVLSMLTEFSPFFGAAGLGPDEVSKVFEFAGTAGIAPTTGAWKQYFSQLQAGFTSSKATNFGEFMTGLQKGGTAYMAMGGTLPEAISAFSGARSVMANEALAATLVEQIARLSAGGYEKPRAAIEKGLGVKWSQLSMDQRTAAVLQYVGSIPGSQRAQRLTAQGFPAEMTTQISKMVTPEAMGAMAATREAVSAAEPAAVDQQAQAYLDSVLGKSRQTEADIAAKQMEAGPKFADWQTRLKKAKAEHEILVAKGQDRMLMSDIIEPYVMAMEGLDKDLTALIGELPEGERREKAIELQGNIQKTITAMQPGLWLGLGILPAYGIRKFFEKGGAAKLGYNLSQRFDAIAAESAPQTINNEFHYHHEHITNYNPMQGRDDNRGGRAKPEDLL